MFQESTTSSSRNTQPQPSPSQVNSIYIAAMFGSKTTSAHLEQYEDHHNEKAPLAQNAGNIPRVPAPGGPRPPFPLDIPLVNALKGKRVILASKSPRRKQLLNSVCQIELFLLPLFCRLIFRYREAMLRKHSVELFIAPMQYI